MRIDDDDDALLVDKGVNVLDGELNAMFDVLVILGTIMSGSVVGDGLLLNTLLILVLEAAAGAVVAEVVVAVARVNAKADGKID